MNWMEGMAKGKGMEGVEVVLGVVLADMGFKVGWDGGTLVTVGICSWAAMPGGYHSSSRVLQCVFGCENSLEQ